MENVKQESSQAASKLHIRGGFSTSLGALFATIGSAVGLGNIWKFPYLTGENGGAAFILVYLISTLLVGLPIMIAELMMGRAARANAIKTLQMLAPKKNSFWWLIGAMGALASFLIMAFYTEVAGWVFAYIPKAITGSILSTNPEVTSQAFTDLVTNPIPSLICQWVVLAFISVILIRGVAKGIENTTRRLIPLLFVLLIIIGIRSLTLPNAAEGLAFLFTPDFTKITAQTILIAVGLAFFKLSVGMGTMITYGSYYVDDQNIPTSATRAMLSDLFISLLAGIAIFPAVFSFGFQPDAGASLLFITIPSVFASMPLGNIFMVLFFFLTAIAATGAMLSLAEVPIAFLEEKLNLSRTKATLITTGLLALIGSTAALSSSTLADVTVFGKTFFDLFDFATSNIMLPLGGLFIAIFTGWVWGPEKIKAALSNHGALKNDAIVSIIIILLRYVTPVLVLVVLLDGLNLLPF
jgi:neurotransmitter:Na+ symporter, NSS family